MLELSRQDYLENSLNEDKKSKLVGVTVSNDIDISYRQLSADSSTTNSSITTANGPSSSALSTLEIGELQIDGLPREGLLFGPRFLSRAMSAQEIH